MDSSNLGGPLRTGRQIRGTPFAADTLECYHISRVAKHPKDQSVDGSNVIKPAGETGGGR